MPNDDNRWYTIITAQAGDDDAARVDIYDFIGESFWGEEDRGVSARKFAKDFRAIKADRIDVHINSPGGSVFDGMAIANAIKQHKARVVVHVDGLAASIASVIALAGDEVRMASNAFMMIHGASDVVWGTAEQMRKTAETLDKLNGKIADVYTEAAGGTTDRAVFVRMMAEETWMTAEECLDLGMIDGIDEESDATFSRSAAACLGRYEKVPAPLKRRLKRVAGAGARASGESPVPDETQYPEPETPIDPPATDAEPSGDGTDPDASTPSEEAETMADSPKQPDTKTDPAAAPSTVASAASFKQLNALVPADVPDRATFILACQAEECTEAQAQAKLVTHVMGAHTAEKKRADQFAALGKQGTGAPAVPRKNAAGADAPGGEQDGAYAAFESYTDLVAHLQSFAGGNMNKAKAILKANAARPDLRAAYARHVVASN